MSKYSRDRVKGFLHTDGRKMVNEDGETVVLRGWGVGSWMNPEGFMIGGVPLFAEVGGFNDFALPRRFERGRTMETTVRELAGTAYAKEFAKKWYRNYLSEEDIRLMAEMGYNSVRLPVSARLFLAEEPEIQWIEEGFAVLLELLALLGIYFSLDIGIGASVDRCIAGFFVHVQDIHQSTDYLVLLIDLAWVNRDVIAALARSKDIAVTVVDSPTLGIERLIVDTAPVQLVLSAVITKYLVSSKLESACSACQAKKRQNERAPRHRFTRYVCMQQVGLWNRPAGTCSTALSGLRGPKTCYGIVVMVVLVLWHEAPGI